MLLDDDLDFGGHEIWAPRTYMFRNDEEEARSSEEGLLEGLESGKLVMVQREGLAGAEPSFQQVFVKRVKDAGNRRTFLGSSRRWISGLAEF